MNWMAKWLIIVIAAGASLQAAGQVPMQLPSDPDLSPDGKQLAFSWRGDIWLCSSGGGVARPLTLSEARDRQPKFSPDGKTIAFVSDRSGADQVYVVPRQGGMPKQLTFHSEGCQLEQWYPDGQSLLISAERDHFWRHAERFFQIAADERSAERLLFDAYGSDGRWSPDGTRLLFTREGVAWWRKGYRGSQASQVWMFDRRTGEFSQVVAPESGARWPLWHPDGRSFYYVGGQSGAFNLWWRDLETGEERQLTHFEDDGVVGPCISSDGKVIVFRVLFDFYRFEPESGRPPRRLRILYRGDRVREPIERVALSEATGVAFSDDGLEIAFIAGGDLWVMDTVLREPKQVTDTPEEERSPVFSPDGLAIVFVSDSGGRSDVWRATRADGDKYWWQNESFRLERLTDDGETETDVRFSPDGQTISFVKGRGDLWLMDANGKNPRRLIASWNQPDYDWSPDSRWIVFAQYDNDFNRDVHIVPADGSQPPRNISQHPDNDFGPVWSPDGKVIAFLGRRIGDETDIYFVYLQKSESELTARDRKLREAIEAMQKARKQPSGGRQPAKPDEQAGSETSAEEEKPAEKKEEHRVVIDFEDIVDRIRRVAIPDVEESGLFWSPDSKRLAFTATINGQRGTYTIAPPDDLSAKLLTSRTGTQARWLRKGNQIVWLSGGRPGRVTAQGQATSYEFTARQVRDVRERYRVAFDLCWREMRDYFYDGRLNHRNWDAIRRKYQDAARGAVDDRAFATVVQLMLGELNGSHLGFSVVGGRRGLERGWSEQTAHLGVRFDRQHKGPGLKVRDVIYNSPASQTRSQLEPGDVILRIDGHEVDPDMDLTQVLNGPLDRDLQLHVRGADGATRDVVLRPISYRAARSLLYEHWIRQNRAYVEQQSEGRFGYLHIQGMNMSSFYRFERELFSAAAGKDGLVIDVRENGGGFTTDHLLTVLTQPVHAITVPRGGGPGYPQDRKVYASWHKPIVVLCNQNSFSNAEIFSHAIKTLQRGRLVGVPTSGSVISTGSTRILDLGILRKPFRGWFVLDTGQDMELNGAVPHFVVWPQPGDLPSGNDPQLAKAVEVLREDVEAYLKRPQPKLIYASEREGRGGK